MSATKTTVAVILLLLLLPGAAAWGVNPARQRAAYHQDQQTLSVTIENPERAEGYFKVIFSGSLAQYAHYATQIIYLSESMTQETVPFSLKLPGDLPPGKNAMTVTFEQIPGPKGASTVTSLVTLIADVSVDVPLYGNHIAAELTIAQSKETEPTPFTVSIVNQGEDAIAVWADVTIYGPTNQELGSWQTEKSIINYQSTGKIMTYWQGQKEPGEYAIDVALHYGDKTLMLRDKFMVGGKEVVSESIGSSSFRLGGIVPLDVTVRNKWNDVIKGVFADVYVLTKEGLIVQSFKTFAADVEGRSRVALTGYWDTGMLVVGSYNVNVVVSYDGGQSQQSYPVVVKMDELEVGGQATGMVSGGDDGFSQNSLFILLLVVLVVTNVVIIAYFRRMRRK